MVAPGGRAGRRDGREARLPRPSRLRPPRSSPTSAPEVSALLERSFTAHAVEQICERLKLATDTLDGQITVTTRAHDALSYRLARTRWRGVYRLDGLYVVPYHDDLGIERQPEFTDAGEARRFRDGVKLAHQAKSRGIGLGLPWDSGPGG